MEVTIEKGRLTKTVPEGMAKGTSVKAGDKLTKTQCKDLVKQMRNLKNPYTCPHGRPLKIETTLNELNSFFRRK